jgi:hypothetical protein
MAVMSGLAGLSNHWRERSFLIWAAVGFLGIGAFPERYRQLFDMCRIGTGRAMAAV